LDRITGIKADSEKNLSKHEIYLSVRYLNICLWKHYPLQTPIS